MLVIGIGFIGGLSLYCWGVRGSSEVALAVLLTLPWQGNLGGQGDILRRWLWCADSWPPLIFPRLIKYQWPQSIRSGCLHQSPAPGRPSGLMGVGHGKDGETAKCPLGFSGEGVEEHLRISGCHDGILARKGCLSPRPSVCGAHAVSSLSCCPRSQTNRAFPADWVA